MDLYLSIAFHPHTNGQTERVNQVLEGYLHHYSNFQQDGWADLLPLAEHAYNRATSVSTKVRPFCTNYGFNPKTQWVKPLAVDPTKMDWTNPAAEKLLQHWQNIWSYLQDNILQAQERMAKYYNMSAQKQPVIKP